MIGPGESKQEFDNSGEAFESDVDDIYGLEDEEHEDEETEDDD